MSKPNGENKTVNGSQVLQFRKNIGGADYYVEAVMDKSSESLRVISAYIR